MKVDQKCVKTRYIHIACQTVRQALSRRNFKETWSLFRVVGWNCVWAFRKRVFWVWLSWKMLHEIQLLSLQWKEQTSKKIKSALETKHLQTECWFNCMQGNLRVKLFLHKGLSWLIFRIDLEKQIFSLLRRKITLFKIYGSVNFLASSVQLNGMLNMYFVYLCHHS